MAEEKKTNRPFPALTTAQRYQFDSLGYAIVPDVFTRDECGAMIGALKRCRRDLRAANPQDPMKARIKRMRFAMDLPHHAFISSMYEVEDVLLNYTCHPRCVGFAAEVMGCEPRITEFNAHLNSRDAGGDFTKPPQFGFHHGVDIPFGSHIAENLYHCNFVKTLANLTDLGSDDGGTVVVAGSHKSLDYAGAIKAAYEDRSIIHQVIAPAGSVLVFPETLIHATGQIRSDKERAIIICGYGPLMYRRWDEGDSEEFAFSPEFLARMPASLKTLYMGKAHWDRQPRYRKLSDPVDPRKYEPEKWGSAEG